MKRFYIHPRYLEAINNTSQQYKGWDYCMGIDIDQVLCRNIFLKLVLKANSSEFDRFSNHYFWKNWTSVKSKHTNNILHFATNSSKDTAWIDKLLKSNIPVGNPPAFIQALERPVNEIIPVLKIYEENNISLENEELLQVAAMKGYYSVIDYLFSKGLFKVRPKNSFIEAHLLKHSRLDGKLKSNHEEALKRIFDYWGKPDIEYLKNLWKSVLGAYPSITAKNELNSKAKAVLFLESLWNPNHENWDDSDTLLFVETMTRINAIDVLQQKIESGWSFANHWEIAKNLCLMFKDQNRLKRIEELIVLEKKVLIDNALEDIIDNKPNNKKPSIL